MSRERSAHVVVDANDQTFKCKRCGEAVPLPLPAKVETFCAMAYAFEEQHRQCPVPVAEPVEIHG